MIVLEIASLLIAASLVTLTLMLIPVLGEIKKSARSLHALSESMQVELKPLIKELRETAADIQVVSSAAAANADGMGLLMNELGQAGQHIRTVNKVIGIASVVASNTSTWMTGAKVAGKFIADRIISKRSAKNGKE